MNKKVVVITLNYNQNDYTIKCINSLLDSSYKNFIVLLIDNGSTEENYIQLQSYMNKDSRIVLNRIIKNCGYVGGINYGLEEGIKLNPDYFLIMNNDTIIDKDAITELVNVIQDNQERAIISGKIYYYDKPIKLQFIGLSYTNKRLLQYKMVGANEIDSGQYNRIIEMDNLDDIYWLIPAKLYLEIGGYSNYFWFNYEQEDFAIRAKKAGYKLIYTPNAKIWHKGSASIGGSDYNPNQAYWMTQSTLILHYIHLNKINFFNFYIMTIISIILTFLKSLYFKFIGKSDILNYAKAKYHGWTYFNKWVINKNVNTGENPFNK